MPLKVADRVKEYTTSSGIGGVSFIGAYNGFQRFDDALTSGDTTYYVIEENDKWEVGVGTYGSNNLERDTILASSNNGSKISLGGSGTVSIVYPADKAVFIDDLIVVSGISNYASGQAVINQDDIVAVSGLIGTADFLPGGSGALIDQNTDQISSVSGWADYTFLKSDDDTYVSGIATYASGQSVENEIGISSVSGIAAYASGHNLQGITDNGSTTTNAITVSNNNITASSGLFDSLDMTPLAEADYPPHQEGVLFYDSDNHTISLYNDEADVTLQLGQEEFLRVRNNTGATITNGTAVLITGSHGNAAPTISGAIATSESASQVVGLATHDIEDSSFGYVTTYGIVRNVDTSHCSDGDEIFLSATQIGSGVNVSPTIPNYKVTIGHVIRSHGANGSVLVQIGHPKLGGGDLKSEAELNLSGVPFVTSIADTTAGGSQTDPLFIFDSDNRQLQLGSGIQLLDGAPSNTSNVLYNEGGSLKFDGSPVGSVTTSQLEYVSGVAVYGSGQSIENENDIVAVSGISAYASGQAIQNESDIVAVSGLIGVADFLPGATGALIDQNTDDIATASGALRNSINTNATDIVTASGSLRNSINQNVLDIASVSGLLTPSGDSFTFSNAILTYFNSDGGSFSADLSSISGDVYAMIVDGAPATLDTLNEIAAALNDDANLANTLTNLITSTSGNLQSQITDNVNDLSSTSGYFETRVDDADAEILAVSGWSGAYADAGDAAVSGWAGTYADAGDAAVSGWSESTFATLLQMDYVSGVAAYSSGQAIDNEVDIVAVSGIAAYASGNTVNGTPSGISFFGDDGAITGNNTLVYDGQSITLDGTIFATGERVITSDEIFHIKQLTQSEYDALTPDSATFYIITDASEDAAVSGYFESRADNADTNITAVSGIAAYASGNTITGTPSGILFFDDAGSVSGDATLTYDGADVALSGNIVASGKRVITSEQVYHIEKLTQAEYDAITPDAATFYIITDPDVEGPVVQPYREVSSNTTILSTDYTINATAGLVLTLPTAVGNGGLMYNIKNTSTGNVIVSGVGGNTIDGEPSFEISTQHQSIKVQSTNSNWIIL